MADEMPLKDALNEWYHRSSNAGHAPAAQVQTTPNESPESELFDALLWEVKYAGDKDKPFYVTAALKLLELWRR